MIVTHLKTPYYAVIFTSLLTDDLTEYNKTAERMEELGETTRRVLRNRIGKELKLELRFPIGKIWNLLSIGKIM